MPVDRCTNLAVDRLEARPFVRSFDGSTTSSAVNGSRCDRIRRGEGASKRDSKGQKRDEERRREREGVKQGTERMVGTEEKEEGARKNGKMREERKDVGNGSRILTNWKAVKPKAQRRARSPALISQREKSIDVGGEARSGKRRAGSAFLEPK